MPKRTGLGDKLYFDGYDISGDVGAIQGINQSQGLQDQTGLDKFAMERKGLLKTAAIQFNNFFNANDDLEVGAVSTEVLKQLEASDHQVIYLKYPQAQGSNACCLVVKKASYGLSRGQDGSLLGDFSAEGNGFPAEWGRLLTDEAQVTTGAEDLTGLDGVAGTSNGWAAYLQVLDFDGTNITFTLEESSDNGGDAYAAVTNGAFTQVTTGPAFERIDDDGALERYVRVAITGTFTTCTFVIVLVRY